METKDLQCLRKILINLIELKVLTNGKKVDYYYDRLELSNIIELLEDVNNNIRKLSKAFKKKYDNISWDIIDKAKYDDPIMGESMKIKDAYNLASKLYGKFYNKIIKILEHELQKYYHSLCIERKYEI